MAVNPHGVFYCCREELKVLAILLYLLRAEVRSLFIGSEHGSQGQR